MLEIDPGLIAEARHDTAALEPLIEALWPEAYRIAFAILRDAGLAEDAAQDACAKIARSLGALKNPATFRAWAYRGIVNAAISTARRRRPMSSLECVREAPVHEDPAQRIDLVTALAALPIEQRAAVILHYYAGLTSEEIAGAAGLRASTVRFRLMLARRALEKALHAADVSIAESARGATHG